MDTRVRLELEAELTRMLHETERVRSAGGDRSQLLAAAERSPHAVVIFARSSGELVVANRAAERMWMGSRTADEVNGAGRFAFVGESSIVTDLSTWALVRSTPSARAPTIERVLIERRDGSRRVVCGGCAVTCDGGRELAVCIFGELARAVETPEAAHHRVSFLVQATTPLLSSSNDPDEMLCQVACLAVPAIADGCVIYVLDEPTEATRRVADKWSSPETGEAVREMRRRLRRDHARPRWLGRLERTAVAELYPKLTDAILRAAAQDTEQLEQLRRIGISSMMFAPLRSRKRVLGGIALVSTDPARVYERADLDMLEQLGDAAGLAVENARLYRYEQQARATIERAARGMRRLETVTAELGAALTQEEVARAVVDATMDAGALSGGIWLLAGAGALRLLCTNGSQRADLPPPPAEFLVRPGAVVTDVLSAREPVFVGTRAELAERFPFTAERLPTAQAVASCPLFDGNELLGVLFFTFGAERAFDPDERSFFRLMGEHCTEALRRARAYEAEQRARSEMALLYHLLDAVNHATTVAEVYEPALEVVARAMGVTASAIMLADEEGRLRFEASRGISEEYKAAIEGPSPWPPGVTDPEPVLIADVAAEPAAAPFLGVLRAERIQALALIPLVHRGKLLGALMVYSSEPRAFSADEVRLAQGIAAQLAQALIRRRQEADVEAARAAAEHANRMKDEFLAVVSHELRTPLSAIVGWSAILQTDRRSDPATLAKGLAAIERNARAQATIIDDLLDMSRIIRGKLVLEARPVAFVPIVTETIESLRTSATAKQIDLSFDVRCDECVLIGDVERLRQITWNLLSNAVKFTPPGGRVHVDLRREPSSVVLEVEDTGAGIDPNVLPYVFDRFRQADSSTTRCAGGLGLGLAIVRQLVELHGGQVTARSAGVGKGSTFTVTFPIRAETSAPAPAEKSDPELARRAAAPAANPDLGGARVLVVDDEADAREMVREAIASYGAIVEVAGSVGEALVAVNRFHPATIVMDIAMPGEDGYALLRRVRALPGADGRVPAVAMTAYARREDVERAHDAGFQSHVAKPAHPEDLARAVAQTLRPRTGRLLASP